MSVVIVLVHAAILILELSSHLAFTAQLCSHKATRMEVALTTHKSINGNWEAEVNIERGRGRRDLGAVAGTEPWTFKVNATRKLCEESDVFQVTLSMTATHPKLGSDYKLFPGIGYYKLHNDATTWELARQICVDEGAHLAIINSEQESEVLKKMFAQTLTFTGAQDNNWAWIGIRRISDEYFTIYGKLLNNTGFMRWYPGEPNKRVADDCIVVNRDARGLGDAPCPWKVTFFCEHEL